MSIRTAIFRSQALRGILSDEGGQAGGLSQLSLRVQRLILLQSSAGGVIGNARPYNNAPAVEAVPAKKRVGGFPEPIAQEINYCTDLAEYNNFVYQCSKETRVATRAHLLRDIYKDMLMDGVRPNAHTYQMCITGMSRTKLANEAFYFFDEMKAHGIAPKEVVYNSLILAAGRCYDLKKAFKIAEEMEANGVKPSPLTYMFLLKVCGDVGHIGEAEGVRRRMEEQGLHLTRFCYVSLIDAQKNSRHRRPTPEIIPNIFALLNEWRQGQKERLGSLAQSPGAPQSAAEKQVAEAEKAMEEEEKFAEESKEDRLLGGRGRASDRAADQKLRDELAVYNAVMGACVELNHPDGLHTVFELVKEDNLTPNRDTFMVLFKHYLNRNNVARARQMWEEVRGMMKPSLEIYIAAMEHCLQKNLPLSFTLAAELLEQFRANGYFLNMFYGSQLLVLASKAKRMEDLYMADKIWACMDAAKFVPRYDAALSYLLTLVKRNVPEDDPRMMLVRKLVKQRPKVEKTSSMETTVF